MGCERRVVYDLINVIQGEANLNQALIKDKQCDQLYVLAASQTRDKDALTQSGFEKVLADANNGNWQTAWRWRRFLSPLYPVRLVKTWPDADAAGDAAMIALHARRSAASIAAWHARHGGGRLAAVLRYSSTRERAQ